MRGEILFNTGDTIKVRFVSGQVCQLHPNAES